jgi:hypothetical protein
VIKGLFAELSRMSAGIGLSNTLLYVVSRTLAKLSFGHVKLLKYYITAQPVPAVPLTPPRRGQSIVVSEGTPGQARSTPFGRPAAAIEHRLKHGARYIVACKDDRLLGFQWFTLQDYPEDEVRCRFELNAEDRCAWDFDIYVQPEARMQPVFTKLWDTVNGIFREHGIEYSLSRINVFNQASVQAHARLGAETIGWAAFLVAGPMQLSILPTQPWLHLSFADAQAPAMPVSRLARRRKTVTQFSV